MATVTKPLVPEGLRDLMKDLTREILKEKPTDIYDFAENYFESRLPKKENYAVKSFEKQNEKYDFSYIENPQRYQVPVALVYTIIPESLTNLIKDLIKAVLREQPENLCDFAVEYFRHMKAATSKEEQTESQEINYSAYEHYFSNKERFLFTPYVKCTCGRTLGEAYASSYQIEHLNYIQKIQTKKSSYQSKNFTDAERNTEKPDIKQLKKNSNNKKSYSEKYIHSIYVIQKYFRRYLNKKNATTKTNNESVINRHYDSNTTALPVIPQLHINQNEAEYNSEDASYTSASTAQLSATESGREISELSTSDSILTKTIIEGVEVENDEKNIESEYGRVKTINKSGEFDISPKNEDTNISGEILKKESFQQSNASSKNEDIKKPSGINTVEILHKSDENISSNQDLKRNSENENISNESKELKSKEMAFTDVIARSSVNVEKSNDNSGVDKRSVDEPTETYDEEYDDMENLRKIKALNNEILKTCDKIQQKHLTSICEDAENEEDHDNSEKENNEIISKENKEKENLENPDNFVPLNSISKEEAIKELGKDEEKWTTKPLKNKNASIDEKVSKDDRISDELKDQVSNDKNNNEDDINRSNDVTVESTENSKQLDKESDITKNKNNDELNSKLSDSSKALVDITTDDSEEITTDSTDQKNVKAMDDVIDKVVNENLEDSEEGSDKNNKSSHISTPKQANNADEVQVMKSTKAGLETIKTTTNNTDKLEATETGLSGSNEISDIRPETKDKLTKENISSETSDKTDKNDPDKILKDSDKINNNSFENKLLNKSKSIHDNSEDQKDNLLDNSHVEEQILKSEFKVSESKIDKENPNDENKSSANIENKYGSGTTKRVLSPESNNQAAALENNPQSQPSIKPKDELEYTKILTNKDLESHSNERGNNKEMDKTEMEDGSSASMGALSPESTYQFAVLEDKSQKVDDNLPSTNQRDNVESENKLENTNLESQNNDSPFKTDLKNENFADSKEVDNSKMENGSKASMEAFNQESNNQVAISEDNSQKVDENLESHTVSAADSKSENNTHPKEMHKTEMNDGSRASIGGLVPETVNQDNSENLIVDDNNLPSKEQTDDAENTKILLNKNLESHNSGGNNTDPMETGNAEVGASIAELQNQLVTSETGEAKLIKENENITESMKENTDRSEQSDINEDQSEKESDITDNSEFLKDTPPVESEENKNTLERRITSNDDINLEQNIDKSELSDINKDQAEEKANSTDNSGLLKDIPSVKSEENKNSSGKKVTSNDDINSIKNIDKTEQSDINNDQAKEKKDSSDKSELLKDIPPTESENKERSSEKKVNSNRDINSIQNVDKTEQSDINKDQAKEKKDSSDKSELLKDITPIESEESTNSSGTKVTLNDDMNSIPNIDETKQSDINKDQTKEKEDSSDKSELLKDIPPIESEDKGNGSEKKITSNNDINSIQNIDKTKQTDKNKDQAKEKKDLNDKSELLKDIPPIESEDKEHSSEKEINSNHDISSSQNIDKTEQSDINKDQAEEKEDSSNESKLLKDIPPIKSKDKENSSIQNIDKTAEKDTFKDNPETTNKYDSLKLESEGSRKNSNDESINENVDMEPKSDLNLGESMEITQKEENSVSSKNIDGDKQDNISQISKNDFNKTKTNNEDNPTENSKDEEEPNDKTSILKLNTPNVSNSDNTNKEGSNQELDDPVAEHELDTNTTENQNISLKNSDLDVNEEKAMKNDSNDDSTIPNKNDDEISNAKVINVKKSFKRQEKISEESDSNINNLENLAEDFSDSESNNRIKREIDNETEALSTNDDDKKYSQLESDDLGHGIKDDKTENLNKDGLESQSEDQKTETNSKNMGDSKDDGKQVTNEESTNDFSNDDADNSKNREDLINRKTQALSKHSDNATGSKNSENSKVVSKELQEIPNEKQDNSGISSERTEKDIPKVYSEGDENPELAQTGDINSSAKVIDEPNAIAVTVKESNEGFAQPEEKENNIKSYYNLKVESNPNDSTPEGNNTNAEKLKSTINDDLVETCDTEQSLNNIAQEKRLILQVDPNVAKMATNGSKLNDINKEITGLQNKEELPNISDLDNTNTKNEPVSDSEPKSDDKDTSKDGTDTEHIQKNNSTGDHDNKEQEIKAKSKDPEIVEKLNSNTSEPISEDSIVQEITEEPGAENANNPSMESSDNPIDHQNNNPTAQTKLYTINEELKPEREESQNLINEDVASHIRHVPNLSTDSKASDSLISAEEYSESRQKEQHLEKSVANIVKEYFENNPENLNSDESEKLISKANSTDNNTKELIPGKVSANESELNSADKTIEKSKPKTMDYLESQDRKDSLSSSNLDNDYSIDNAEMKDAPSDKQSSCLILPKSDEIKQFVESRKSTNEDDDKGDINVKVTADDSKSGISKEKDNKALNDNDAKDEFDRQNESQIKELALEGKSSLDDNKPGSAHHPNDAMPLPNTEPLVKELQHLETEGEVNTDTIQLEERDGNILPNETQQLTNKSESNEVNTSGKKLLDLKNKSEEMIAEDSKSNVKNVGDSIDTLAIERRSGRLIKDNNVISADDSKDATDEGKLEHNLKESKESGQQLGNEDIADLPNKEILQNIPDSKESDSHNNNNVLLSESEKKSDDKNITNESKYLEDIQPNSSIQDKPLGKQKMETGKLDLSENQDIGEVDKGEAVKEDSIVKKSEKLSEAENDIHKGSKTEEFTEDQNKKEINDEECDENKEHENLEISKNHNLVLHSAKSRNSIEEQQILDLEDKNLQSQNENSKTLESEESQTIKKQFSADTTDNDDKENSVPGKTSNTKDTENLTKEPNQLNLQRNVSADNTQNQETTGKEDIDTERNIGDGSNKIKREALSQNEELANVSNDDKDNPLNKEPTESEQPSSDSTESANLSNVESNDNKKHEGNTLKKEPAGSKQPPSVTKESANLLNVESNDDKIHDDNSLKKEPTEFEQSPSDTNESESILNQFHNLVIDASKLQKLLDTSHSGTDEISKVKNTEATNKNVIEIDPPKAKEYGNSELETNDEKNKTDIESAKKTVSNDETNDTNLIEKESKQEALVKEENNGQPKVEDREESKDEQVYFGKETLNDIGNQNPETFIGNQNLTIGRIRHLNEGLLGSISGQRFAETHLRSFWKEYELNNSVPLGQFPYDYGEKALNDEDKTHAIRKNNTDSKNSAKNNEKVDKIGKSNEETEDNEDKTNFIRENNSKNNAKDVEKENKIYKSDEVSEVVEPAIMKETLNASKLTPNRNQAISPAPKDMERMPRYFCGILDNDENDKTNRVKRSKTYKEPTAFTIPMDDSNKKHGIKMHPRKVELTTKDIDENDKINNIENLNPTTTSDDTEPLLESETPTKLFQDLSEFEYEIHDIDFDTTYTLDEMGHLKAQNFYGAHLIDISESSLTPEPKLQTIIELSESETPKPTDLLHSIDDEFLAILEKNTDSTSSSWTTGSKEDTSFLSDEFLDEKHISEYATGKFSKSENGHGGIYEFSTDNIVSHEVSSEIEQLRNIAQAPTPPNCDPFDEDFKESAARTIQEAYRQYKQKHRSNYVQSDGKLVRFEESKLKDHEGTGEASYVQNIEKDKILDDVNTKNVDESKYSESSHNSNTTDNNNSENNGELTKISNEPIIEKMENKASHVEINSVPHIFHNKDTENDENVTKSEPCTAKNDEESSEHSDQNGIENLENLTLQKISKSVESSKSNSIDKNKSEKDGKSGNMFTHDELTNIPNVSDNEEDIKEISDQPNVDNMKNLIKLNITKSVESGDESNTIDNDNSEKEDETTKISNQQSIEHVRNTTSHDELNSIPNESKNQEGSKEVLDQYNTENITNLALQNIPKSQENANESNSIINDNLERDDESSKISSLESIENVLPNDEPAGIPNKSDNHESSKQVLDLPNTENIENLTLKEISKPDKNADESNSIDNDYLEKDDKSSNIPSQESIKNVLSNDELTSIPIESDNHESSKQVLDQPNAEHIENLTLKKISKPDENANESNTIDNDKDDKSSKISRQESVEKVFSNVELTGIPNESDNHESSKKILNQIDTKNIESLTLQKISKSVESVNESDIARNNSVEGNEESSEISNQNGLEETLTLRMISKPLESNNKTNYIDTHNLENESESEKNVDQQNIENYENVDADKLNSKSLSENQENSLEVLDETGANKDEILVLSKSVEIISKSVEGGKQSDTAEKNDDDSREISKHGKPSNMDKTNELGEHLNIDEKPNIDNLTQENSNQFVVDTNERSSQIQIETAEVKEDTNNIKSQKDLNTNQNFDSVSRINSINLEKGNVQNEDSSQNNIIKSNEIEAKVKIDNDDNDFKEQTTLSNKAIENEAKISPSFGIGLNELGKANTPSDSHIYYAPTAPAAEDIHSVLSLENLNLQDKAARKIQKAFKGFIKQRSSLKSSLPTATETSKSQWFVGDEPIIANDDSLTKTTSEIPLGETESYVELTDNPSQSLVESSSNLETVDTNSLSRIPTAPVSNRGSNSVVDLVNDESNNISKDKVSIAGTGPTKVNPTEGINQVKDVLEKRNLSSDSEEQPVVAVHLNKLESIKKEKALKYTKLIDQFISSERHHSIVNRQNPKAETYKDIKFTTPDITEITKILKEFNDSQRAHNDSLIPYEKLEDPCIKKIARRHNFDDSETSVDEAADTNTASSSDVDDTEDSLSIKTVKLFEPEMAITKMQQRRDSTTKISSSDRPKEYSFDEPSVAPIDNLDTDEEAIVVNKLQREETRESSAQSDTDVVIGGDDKDENFYYLNKIELNETFPAKGSLKRLHTIAADGDAKALLKNVTIDESIKYIEPPDYEVNSGSLCLDDDTEDNIRRKMMAYSLSEADSDCFDKASNTNSESKPQKYDDFNVSTALVENGDSSTETESTIVSAVTKIQAGARGYLTRKRLGKTSLTSDGRSMPQDGLSKASFGNAAISESLEYLVQDAAAKRIQKFYRQHHKEKLMQAKQEADNMCSDFATSMESTLAQKRSIMLQRGDALRNNSTPDEGNSSSNGSESENSKIHLKLEKSERSRTLSSTESSNFEKQNLDDSDGRSTSMATEAKTSAANRARKIEENKMKWLAMRQNSMPVQIDCEVLRVIPKHMRKKIKSAESEKKRNRRRVPMD